MTGQTPTDPTAIDPAEAAKKITEAGIADEAAAYVAAGDIDSPAETAETADTSETADAEAHPS